MLKPLHSTPLEKLHCSLVTLIGAANFQVREGLTLGHQKARLIGASRGGYSFSHWQTLKPLSGDSGGGMPVD